jgi:D-beta-D-heptose 7-phosphate kinase / D-beta-D-heptose 1-phosphate adenosyltransferase
VKPFVVVGDALLDRDVEGRVERICPEAPVPVVEQECLLARPGGAGLAAALAAVDGCEVVLVTALADDAGGRELGALLDAAGVEVIDLGLLGPTPEKVRVRADRRLLVRVDRGGVPGAAIGALSGAAESALRAAGAILVSDYGRGVASASDIRSVLASVATSTRVVWDPHPRGREPVPRVHLATPNSREAARLVREEEPARLRDAARLAGRLRHRWRALGVAVTLGSGGALLLERDGSPFHVPAPHVPEADACGAGDRFAATAATMLAEGALLAEAVEAAVRSASAFVATGGAGAFALHLDPRAQREEAAAPEFPPSEKSVPPNTHATAGGRTGLARARARSRASGRVRVEDAQRLAARVRAAGGTVVATGGCFDLLHAGHVTLLEQARALGDCLIVLLNADASVRRLKGPDRPLVPEEDRAAVLRALAAVDAVALFEEPTPSAALRRIRPDVWVKGGDYTREELPEASVLRDWDGQAVVLPYVPGRSTTRLIAEAQSRG